MKNNSNENNINLSNTRSNNFKDLYKNNKKKEKKNILLIILLTISLILSTVYIVNNVLNIENIYNYGYIVINSIFILLINVCLVITYKNNKQKTGILVLSSMVMNIYLLLILLWTFNFIKL